MLSELVEQTCARLTWTINVFPTTETSKPVAEVPQEPKKEAAIEPTELPTAPPPAPAPTPVVPVVVSKDDNKQELERRRRRLMGY